MHPSDRLIAIAGIFLIIAAAWLIMGSNNIGLVTRGSIQVSDDASNSFSAEMNSPSSLSFSEVKLPSDVEGMTPPRLNVILSDDQMNVGGGNPQNENFDISNRFIGSANFFRKKEGKIEPVIEFVPNSFIVEFDSTIAVENQRAQSSALDAALNQIADYSIRKLAPTHQNDAVSRFAVVNFKGDAQDTRLLQKRIEAVSGVSSVSPNYIAKTTQAGVGNTAPLGSGTPPATRTVVTPNDPYFSQQYMHDKIDSLAAWTQTKGSGSVVAVIDSGVDYLHPDLSSNIWVNAGEIPNNGIDDEGNGYVDDVIGYDFVDTFPDPNIPQEDYLNEDNDPSDYGGHGTHVAGIIAAVANNQKGVAGVCPECKIMSLRAGYAPGWLEHADIVQAIIYATDNGAHVINMSFGGSYDNHVMKAALDYAHINGVVLVAAAGNGNTDEASYPGSYENVIGVAATDSGDNRAGFSNYGYWTDVAAPGVDILSTVPTNGYWLSQSYPPLSYDTGYANISGTSMAAPVVSGVAGLVHAKSPWNLVSIAHSGITSGVKTFQEDLGHLPDHFIGNGVIDSWRAINRSRLDTTALLSIDDSVIQNTINGDALIQGSALSTSFGNVTFTLYESMSQTPMSGFNMQITNQVTNGTLAILPTENLSNGEYIVRGTQHNTLGQVVRIIQKPIKLINLEITDPVQNLVVNPNNGPISFIGTVAGSSLIQYTLEYRTDPNQPFSNQGFIYSDNTAPKTNELLATWVPPVSFPLSTTTEFKLTANYPQKSNSLSYYFVVDKTLKQGWPVNYSHTSNGLVKNWSAPTILPWNSGSGQVNTAFMNTADYLGYSVTEIHLLDSSGSEVPGWPQILPMAIGSLYLGIETGDVLSLADVDNDGKDELIARGEYLGNYNESQTAIFAYTADGTLVSGFPIVTNYSPVTSGIRIIRRSPPLAADLDLDGKMELIVYSANEASGTNQYSLIGIAKQNNQGNYLFSTFMVHTPLTEDIHYTSALATIAIQNMDSDAELEIMGVALDSSIVVNGPIYYSDIESHIFGVNQDGSPVSGWPQKIGDALNHSTSDKIYTISGGIMNENPVLAAIGFIYNNTASTGSYLIYLFSKDGTQLPFSPIVIPPGQNAANLDFPPIFSNVVGGEEKELVVALTTTVNAYNAQGNLVWQGTHSPSFGFWGPIMTAERNGHHSLITHFLHDNYLIQAGNPSPFETVGFEPTIGTIATISKNISVTPYGFVRVGGAVLIPSLSNNELAQAVSLENGMHPVFQWFQLLRWTNPTDLKSGDWPMFMHDKGRTNSGVDPPVVCQDLTNTTITSSISICPGTYSLQNGITIRADNTIPIIVTCNGTQFLGYNTPGSVGITIDSTLNQQGTVELRGCRVDEYSSAVKVSKYVNLTLEDNQFSNTVSISPSGVPLLSNPSVAGTISNNTFTNNASLSISYFGNLSILDNTFSVNGQGIGISNSDNVSVAGNHITHANTSSVNGITVLSSTNGTIFNNTIDGPFQYSVYTNVPSGGNYVVSENNLYIGARDQSFSPGSVTWYNAAAQRGNYWSAHTCTDTQAPIGICDNAYAVYSPPQNPDPKDLYPLANPV